MPDIQKHATLTANGFKLQPVCATCVHWAAGDGSVWGRCAIAVYNHGRHTEEKRAGTLELLMTMPVSDTQIVLGKFLGVVALLGVVLVGTLPYPITLHYLGDLDWGPVIGGYVGLLFLGSAYMAIGLMVSSWTHDQIIAILVAFFLSFGLFVLDRLVGPQSGATAEVLETLSANYHFRNIARGVIDVRDLVYYLSVMVISLTIARTALAARRW